MRHLPLSTNMVRICSLFMIALPLSADWVDWRGPNRDGRSPEKNLPASWSPAGENLAWKVPIGGRSAPVVEGDHLYILTGTGSGKTLQEHLICLNTDTGKQVWEHKINIFLSDVPGHRVAWSSPSVDPATKNVYVLSIHGVLGAYTRDGKPVWQRSLVEDFAFVTTHGGRTVSPVIDGNLVIVSGVSTGWGAFSRAGHRFFAFDTKTGELVYLSAPGGRPYDTTYSPPIVAEIDGVRQLITGGGDGNAHAVKAQTGEALWRFEVSKRGLNSGVVVNGKTAYVTHSEENLDTNEMGLFSAVDATMRGPIKKDQAKFYYPGYQLGFSSPIIDGDRFLQVDNGGNLFAFDVTTGRQIWKQNLGTIQKASSVYGDGKIYVGTENGKFFIIKPHQDRAEKLSEVNFVKPGESEEDSEKIIASVAISEGRIFLVTTKNTYAIGKKQAAAKVEPPQPVNAPAGAAPKWVQVVPAEILIKPGETANFHVRLFDEKGNFIREEKATWALEGLKGVISGDGKYVASSDNVAQAGIIKASVAGLTGTARARIVPPLNWSWDFESIDASKVPMEWVNCNTKFEVRQEEGNRVLAKFADNPATKRARTFMGPNDLHDYTIQSEVRASQKRRQMGDAGVVAQRYNLILFGNAEKLELQSWQPETARTISERYPWKWDTWYVLKLRVENLADGRVKAQGKVWPKGEPEPEKWTVERIDPPNLGEHQGAPGLYADAPFEVFFDNVKVTKN